MQKTTFQSVNLGCDPEFFFAKEGEIIGAEKIISKYGLYDRFYDSKSKIVLDGVQAELNPSPRTCREQLASEIAACFETIQSKLQEHKEHQFVKVSFEQSIEVSEAELTSLSKEARSFGCAPSHNIYSEEHSKIKVNPAEYRFRSAGGHIHLGTYPDCDSYMTQALQSPELLVPLLDLVVGNTCVLIDKNPGNIERRKVYGKAGEFRTPSHGLEYRTLSNFWLQSYQLMGFVMGMARFCVNVVGDSIGGHKSGLKAFQKAVPADAVQKAINNNDFELARHNFARIEDIIVELAGDRTNSYPLTNRTIKEFKYFIEKPLDYWFKKDPFTHWAQLNHVSGRRGWENFAMIDINQDMIKCSKEIKK